jgi:hypothetical protein
MKTRYRMLTACSIDVIGPRLEAFCGAGALAGPLLAPPGASAQARFLAMPGRA